jgi:hypothetical protein
MLQLFRFAHGREPRYPEIRVKPRANSAAGQQFCGFGGVFREAEPGSGWHPRPSRAYYFRKYWSLPKL